MSQCIVIAGGGTGGHIYPGLAIADALKKMDSQLTVEFVGTDQGLEKKIVPKYGYKLHFIKSSKLNYSGRILHKFKALCFVLWGMVQSYFLLKNKKPKAVIGVGGYASVPFVLIASWLGYTTYLWEPNAHPGMANRFLSRFVKHCFIVFAESKNFLKCQSLQVVGMPLRSEIEEGAKRLNTNENQKDKHNFHVLVFGGSQGAQKINAAVAEAVESESWQDDIKLVHQVGTLDYEVFKKKYHNLLHIQCFDFIHDMPTYYLWADIIVCRGGASSLAEAAAYGKIPIIIPLPAADQHQQRNAESLVSQSAALMLLQKDLNASSLMELILRLKNDSQLRKEMSTNLQNFYTPLAALKIAEVVYREI